MQTSNVLTPPAAKPFVPTIVAPAPARPTSPKPPSKVKPAATVSPDFTLPAPGLFHRAAAGSAVHRWESIVFLVVGLSALISILLAFL